MNRVSILEEKGSFRLVACDGRFAVVEARAGQVFGLPDDAEGGRDGASDSPDGIASVARWTGEDEARALMRDLSERGDELSRRIW
ncbi:hypothetical protein HUE56_05525 (plasmid) [Azospirillum oryzae]|uniref:Uncharacterized protein n=1 Tax=Azospirillum oryzae TaxID=286727 RepID=A0A6N1AEM5_9PROT|nr:hypothetical protein [Azospirillum oryzae]KAA0588633.1 hypothetical protein FZ938_12245 [Azospirillum oryzae]QKS49983.1 hypothetical protein HUE56_05525 [Azospirillum oryzae]GLR82396.1 hypothetical protein GCM10007856_50910 [Azospirillum oryzae]